MVYDRHRGEACSSGRAIQQLHPDAFWSMPLPGVTVPALEFAGAGGAASMLYRGSDEGNIPTLAQHAYL